MAYTSLFSPFDSDPYSSIRGDKILIGVPGASQEEFEVEQVGRNITIRYVPQGEDSFLDARSWKFLLRGSQEVSAEFKQGLLTLQLASEAPTRIQINAAA